MSPHVAIIGAGPTGLTAALELTRLGITPTLFEARSVLGGQWAYEKMPGRLQDVRCGGATSVHSAMYPKLRANLPKHAMQVAEYPLPQYTETFPDRETVLSYLECVAKRCGLLPLIRFNSSVEKIDKQGVNWQVTTNHGREAFTHIIIASGKDSFPHIPEIEGLSWFDGPVTHSQSYRFSNPYRGKRVVIVGASNSAEEISLDLSGTADHVFICGTFPQESHTCFPRERAYGQGLNITQHARPVRFEEKAVMLEDRELLSDVHAVILCTGYEYRFPYLDSAIHDMPTRGITMGPLYKNMFYPSDPTLIWLGLPRFTVHFFSARVQSLYCAKVLAGDLRLPCISQLHWQATHTYSILQKNPHDLREYQKHLFEYFEELCAEMDVPYQDWKPVMSALNAHKRQHHEDYRDSAFDMRPETSPTVKVDT